MEAYTNFAEVYDLFMDNIPYKDWSRYVVGLLNDYGIKEGLILDLGCGTGSLTELLADAGYDMIGVDNSEDMLQIAMDKREKSGKNILYLLQDMREFELYGTVRGVISICDCMNYILEYEELVEVFRLVNNYLDPGGLLIFDMNTIYKYDTVMGESTIAEDRDSSSFIWDNYYDKKTRINEYDLSLFIQEEDNLYRKYSENHYQKAYTFDEVRSALLEAGMEFVTAYEAFKKDPVKENSERIYIIAREHGKENKDV